MPSLEDLVDVVNDCDEVIGQRRRGELNGNNFRTAHVFLFDEQDRLLLGQLGRVRTNDPGAWGSSVAAHVLAGESYHAAATRRLDEELGIATPLRLICKIALAESGGTKFVSLFSGRADGFENKEPEHVAALKFTDTQALRRAAADCPENFTATFRLLLACYTALTTPQT